MTDQVVELNEHIWVFRGTVNVGILRNGSEALLIDIGDGEVYDILVKYGIKRVTSVLFTHHHRDQLLGIRKALEKGACIVVPEKERDLFEDVDKFWQDPSKRYHQYNFRPNFLSGERIKADRTLQNGEEILWGPARIIAVATPGHTDGSFSYLVEIEGKKIAFTGDLIYDKGKVIEVYSLQKGFGPLTDYHGFMFAWKDVIESLRRLLQLGAGKFVPSHGEIINETKEAVDLLEARFRRCYESYLSISALWHYFPQLLSTQTASPPLFAAPLEKTPDFLLHIGTSWVIISRGGNAFIMDCGTKEVLKEIESMVSAGKIKQVDGLWITHIHDDHTDAIPLFRERFACPVIAEESVAKVVAKPQAWRLPCLSPNPIPIDKVLRNGESWEWEEFKLTAYHFPGQTLYHSGLLVEGEGLRLFFAGDSFTPTGIDDYCAYNRNFLKDTRGYDYCLRLLEDLKPNLIFNSHIDKPFRFPVEMIKSMRKVLKERREIFRELFPWEDPNFGLDPYWAFSYPYEQEAGKGETIQIKLFIQNHLPRSALYRARLHFPNSWAMQKPFMELQGRAEENEEISLSFIFKIPSNIPSGFYVLFTDVGFDGNNFPFFAECILKIS